MTQKIQGYVVICDQGDSGQCKPVLYVRMRWPGVHRKVEPHHIQPTPDIFDCTVFMLDKPHHVTALHVVNEKFPNAVPVRVEVTRVIDVLPEIPE